MFGLGALLEDILCIITSLASVIEYAAILIVNFLLGAMAGFMEIVSPLLPDMPAFPSLSSLNLSWLPFFIPVSSLVAMVATGVSLFAAMFGIRIALRWVRAL